MKKCKMLVVKSVIKRKKFQKHSKLRLVAKI